MKAKLEISYQPHIIVSDIVKSKFRIYGGHNEDIFIYLIKSVITDFVDREYYYERNNFWKPINSIRFIERLRLRIKEKLFYYDSKKFDNHISSFINIKKLKDNFYGLVTSKNYYVYFGVYEANTVLITDVFYIGEFKNDELNIVYDTVTRKIYDDFFKK